MRNSSVKCASIQFSPSVGATVRQVCQNAWNVLTRTLYGCKYIVSVITGFRMKCRGNIVTDIEVVKLTRMNLILGFLNSNLESPQEKHFVLMDSFCDSTNVHSLWSESSLNLLFHLTLNLCVLFSKDGVYEEFPFLPNVILNCSMKVP